MLLTQLRKATLSPADISEELQKVPFLATVSAKRLDALAKASFLRTYEDGETVVREGEHGHTMFVLLSGQVAVEATDSMGGTLRLTTMSQPGSWFGEGALLGRTRRSASVVSVGDSLLLEIEKIRIEKISKAHAEVLESIQRSSDRRAMETFLAQHRALSRLTNSESTAVLDQSSLQHFSRGATVFEEQGAADDVMILKTGVTKLVRAAGDSTSVLAYFNAGDVIGLHDGVRRPGSLVTMGFVELIRVPAPIFRQVCRSVDGREPGWSDQFHKAEVSSGRQIAVPLQDRTVFNFVDALMADGAQQAQSLLTIDLDLCVRCGNCVQSCEARHGHAKLTRRGKKLTRRRDLEIAGDHKAILFPSSCRHCDSPECMIGCPTGAIHRKPSGEVAIHDFCIGCSNCALRCPWDNITMVETPGREVKGLDTPKIASKCDLCAGYDEPNCVHNCPTKAILRVEPTAYFEEVRALLGKTEDHAVGGARTATEAERDHSRWILSSIAAVLAVVVVLLYATADTYRAFSVRGVALGVFGLVFMLGATALAGRRRLNRFPGRPPAVGAPRKRKTGAMQLGRFFWWVRAHVLLGGLGLLAVVLHSGFRAGGFVTGLLLILLALEVVTGLFGVVYYRWFPRVVSRLERESQLEEDVEAERRTLEKRRQALLEERPEAVLAAARALPGRVGSAWGRLGAAYDPRRAEALALERIAPLLAPLLPDEQRLLEQLAVDQVRRSELRAALGLYRIRRAWLVLHIGIMAMLLTLTAVHVVSVTPFVLGALR